ncbi:PREDICTED: uncharacterized protein LOC106809797 [Priapulus caudatus]|uniref:Uncharacterized protein LOC106809797 n=1 Tax=Priapulus caudatus TaxID=37621 RepID=A0ABM1E8G6_PRICU|nr:PREDICTED: uncharacterized protein LOC106809797 [Priapulus caudatus]
MNINGLDSHGNKLVARINRLPGRVAEVWLMLKLGDGRYFHFPGFPDSKVYNTDDQTFTAGGLQFEVLEPMLKWRITFNGLLREGQRNEWDEQNEGNLIHVQFCFVWTALTGQFSFNDDIDPITISDSIAREKWSLNYLKTIKELSRKHRRYEVCGQLFGKLNVAEESERTLILRGVREHSWGIRDWETYNRYIANWGYLDDGTLYSFSVASFPGILSHFVTGYIFWPSGQQVILKSTDLHLSRLGEFTKAPDKFSFTALAGGC